MYFYYNFWNVSPRTFLVLPENNVRMFLSSNSRNNVVRMFLPVLFPYFQIFAHDIALARAGCVIMTDGWPTPTIDACMDLTKVPHMRDKSL